MHGLYGSQLGTLLTSEHSGPYPDWPGWVPAPIPHRQCQAAGQTWMARPGCQACTQTGLLIEMSKLCFLLTAKHDLAKRNIQKERFAIFIGFFFLISNDTPIWFCGCTQICKKNN